MEVGKALTPEQKARELITRMLQAAGWIYREEALTGRRGGSGFADYLLFDDDGLGGALLEAKPAGTPPLSGKEQTRDYAESIGINHVFLSNGDLHYHWFTKSGNPIRILTFPKPGELDQICQKATIDRTPLWNTPVSETFLRTRTMRYYQVAAVKAVQESAKAGQQSFLLEMATGTGKTTVAAAICRLYLQAGIAERILFLVDRDELYQQAIADLDKALEGQYRVVGYRERDEDWSAPITVATVQALNSAVRHGEEIPPEWFQLIVSDEAHRSISGPRHRDIFDAFNCDKVGRQFVRAENPGTASSTNSASSVDFILALLRAFFLDTSPSTAVYIRANLSSSYALSLNQLDVNSPTVGPYFSDTSSHLAIPFAPPMSSKSGAGYGKPSFFSAL